MADTRKTIFYCFVALTMTSCDCGDDDGPVDQVIVRTSPDGNFDEYRKFYVKDDLTEDEIVGGGVDPDNIPDDVKLNIATANDQASMELIQDGLTEVQTAAEADLIVSSLAATKTEDAYYWQCVPGYWWGYWGPVWDPCAWTEPVYTTYTVGTMLLTLSDPKLEKAVFGGVLQGVAEGQGNPEERIRNGVHTMFLQYPAPAPAP